jgi:hypothetical protein
MVEDTITLYSKQLTERHRYIFDLVLNEMLGLDWMVVESVDDATINYSAEEGGSVRIIPQGLLSEKTVVETQVDFNHDENASYFFENKQNSHLPFDIFAASFFLVSRYEEYLPFIADDHNRFPAEASLLTKNKVLRRPLVNEWVISFAQVLGEVNPHLNIKLPKYSFTSTIDIDQAWKYKNKGIVRNTIGFIQDLLSLKTEKIKERIQVQFGNLPDPFDNFEWQLQNHKKFKVEAIYFFLLGKRGKFDKNIRSNHPKLQSLIKGIAKHSKIGIHPSYASNSDVAILSNEVDTLKELLGTPVNKSRQHFLMHRFPETYQNLVNLGIKEDYTLGYSTHLGFRAGIGQSFLFFDLSSNTTSDLRLHPFCYMDITPLHYLKWSPKKTQDFLEEWMKTLAKNGVHIQTLWHNESFSETERWKNWSAVYLKTLAIHKSIVS